jgi:CTP synthase (UTP-ammonia lyase)
MPEAIRIGLIGDRNPAVAAHLAIPSALNVAAERARASIEIEWLATDAPATIDSNHLARFDGLWCVPACPYASMEGALTAIRFARKQRVPFLGTCGGFQHAIIEYARNVLDIADADHAECRPDAATPIITPLSCSLVGHVGPIRLMPGSLAAQCYGRMESVEKYHCNYGLSPAFRNRLESGELRITGFDESNEPRIVELPKHSFFVGTLFQPELSSTARNPHPLIDAYVRACVGLLAPIRT